MEKEFVPYELALRMKKLKSMDKGFRHGFNEKTFAYFVEGFPNHKLIISNKPKLYSYEYNGGGPELISVPTWHSAFAWFRKKYSLYTELHKKFNGIGVSIILSEYRYDHRQDKEVEYHIPKYFGTIYRSYEEAELACLEKLIEIVESK